MVQESEIDIRARQIAFEVLFADLEKKNGVNFVKQTEFLGCKIEELLSELGNGIINFGQIDMENAEIFRDRLSKTTLWTYPPKGLLKLLVPSQRAVAGLTMADAKNNPLIIVPNGLSPDELKNVTYSAEQQCQPSENIDKVIEVASRFIQRRLLSHELIHVLRGDYLGMKNKPLPQRLIEDSIDYFAMKSNGWVREKPANLINFERLLGNEDLAKRIILTNNTSGFTYS